jgi:hypothetical protein
LHEHLRVGKRDSPQRGGERTISSARRSQTTPPRVRDHQTDALRLARTTASASKPIAIVFAPVSAICAPVNPISSTACWRPSRNTAPWRLAG